MAGSSLTSSSVDNEGKGSIKSLLSHKGVFLVFVKIKISAISAGQKTFNFQFSIKKMDKKRIFDILAKMIVAALTAALTAVTTTSCMGHGPF